MDTMPSEHVQESFQAAHEDIPKYGDVSVSALVGSIVKNRMMPSPVWIQEKMKADLRMRLKEDPEAFRNVVQMTSSWDEQEVIWNALVARLLRDAFSV
jgi:formiminotetrahydrofolate cyclodeaminase